MRHSNYLPSDLEVFSWSWLNYFSFFIYLNLRDYSAIIFIKLHAYLLYTHVHVCVIAISSKLVCAIILWTWPFYALDLTIIPHFAASSVWNLAFQKKKNQTRQPIIVLSAHLHKTRRCWSNDFLSPAIYSWSVTLTPGNEGWVMGNLAFVYISLLLSNPTGCAAGKSLSKWILRQTLALKKSFVQ